MIACILIAATVCLGVGVYSYVTGYERGLKAWKEYQAKELNNMADSLARLFKERVRNWKR